MRSTVFFYLNGEAHQVGSEHAGMMFADYLRYIRGLTGTKIVCAEGDCGACSVLRLFPWSNEMNFVPINSCIMTVAQMDGSALVTVDALGTPDRLTPIQTAMMNAHGSQCGFCTPGFVVALTGLVEKRQRAKQLEPRETRDALTGNLCRCTGYQQIIEAACTIPLKQCTPINKQFFSPSHKRQLLKILNQSLHLKSDTFHFVAPCTLREASHYLNRNKKARLIGAATDLGVFHNKGRSSLTHVLSLHLIPELYQIRFNKKSQVQVGARVSLSDLRRALHHKAPELSCYLNIFASPQIKNVATLVGNVANASPIADTPAFLMICDAEVEVVGAKGSRRIPIEKFFVSYRTTALKAGEFIHSIHFTIPEKKDTWKIFKASERKDLDISSVNAGMRVRLNKKGIIEDVRLAMGGVSDRPLRLWKTEKLLCGQRPSHEVLDTAVMSMHKEISPISDVRGSAAFRRVLAENLLRRFFQENVSPL